MRVASVLRTYLQEIVGAWAEAARQHISPDAEVHPLVLLDQMPDLLLALAEWLEPVGGGRTDRTDEEWRRLVQRHAIDRLHHDFDLSEVVREYRILRDVVRLRMRAVAPEYQPEHDAERLEHALDLAIAEAVDRYTREREQMRASEAERCRLALEAAGLGMWDWSPAAKERDLRWDARTRELLGISPRDPVTYGTFLAALHPDDRGRLDRLIQEKLESRGAGDEYRTEFRVVRLCDGVERWMEARGRVLARDEQGRASRFLGTLLDVTDIRPCEHKGSAAGS